MASTVAKALRRSSALTRLTAALGVEQADLQRNGRGDPELALIITLERVADAVEDLTAKSAASSKASAMKEKKDAK